MLAHALGRGPAIAIPALDGFFNRQQRPRSVRDARFYGLEFAKRELRQFCNALVLRPAGGTAKREDTTNLVLNIDLAPTILELAGATANECLDGRSLVPLLNQQTPPFPWRNEFVIESWSPNLPEFAGLKVSNRKYVESTTPTG